MTLLISGMPPLVDGVMSAAIAFPLPLALSAAGASVLAPGRRTSVAPSTGGTSVAPAVAPPVDSCWDDATFEAAVAPLCLMDAESLDFCLRDPESDEALRTALGVLRPPVLPDRGEKLCGSVEGGWDQRGRGRIISGCV